MTAATPQDNTPAQPVILRLRPSVSFAPLEEGILFKDWDRSFTIKGNRSLYALFERLLPHLERGVERGALLGALPESARGVVGLLLSRLEEHGMCLMAESGQPAEAEAKAFSQAIAYLESVASDPYAAFARIRAARVLAVGWGNALFAAIRALATMGVGRLDCFTPGDDAPVVEACLRAQELVAGEVRRLDFELDGELDLDLRNGHERAAAANVGVDLVIHLQDGMERAAVDRVAAATMAPLLQGVLGDDIGLAGPVRIGGGPGLADALARCRRSLAMPAAGRAVAPVLATLLGNACAFEAFKHLAGLPTPAAQGQVVMVTREPLAVSHHPVLTRAAHEAANAARLKSALTEMQSVKTPPEQQVLLDRLRAMADAEFGILALPHPGDLPQMPLFTHRAAVHGVSGDLVGFADDATDAYLRAGAEGLCRLAAASAADELPTVTLDGAAGKSMARAAMSLALGHSYDAWLQEGIYQCLLRCLTEPTAAGLPLELSMRQIGYAALSGVSALRWKTLAVRFGQKIAALSGILPAVPGVHLAAVVLDGATAGLGAGATLDNALDQALREALARVMLAEAGIALPDHPRLTMVNAAADGAAPGDGRFSFTETLDALTRCGIAIAVHPWCAMPELRKQGFLLGWVGLHAH